MEMTNVEKVLLGNRLAKQNLERQSFLQEWRRNPENQIHYVF
ncbi:MAG: hypothetical protein ACI4PF_00415 [Christensenellales bacterium]